MLFLKIFRSNVYCSPNFAMTKDHEGSDDELLFSCAHACSKINIKSTD